MSYRQQILGCVSKQTARASRSKRCFRPGSKERGVERILTATSRPRRVSRARYTSPIPPAPSGARISYGPSLVPEVKAIMCGCELYRQARMKAFRRCCLPVALRKPLALDEKSAACASDFFAVDCEEYGDVRNTAT